MRISDWSSDVCSSDLKRDQLTICTKFGVVRDPDGPQGSTYDRGIDNSPAHMRRSCEESLARLGVDTIDLYYVHRIDPAVPIEERSEEHTSELQSLMRTSYAVFCLKKQIINKT